MRKLLVVGCGGSGGATLSFMMDQLRSDLARHGIDHLPQGWQFVHLDVPTSPSEVQGMGSVPDLGGAYVGVGPQGQSYLKLDNALSQRLAGGDALDTIATWAPRDPASVHTPLSMGAGQSRALGRMITLSRVGKVRDELERSWQELFKPGVDSEMRSLNIPGAGAFGSADEPLIIVVSSMAGGAGASMALDVCRIMTLIPGVNPRLMAVFMVTPDIFHSIPASSVTGTKPNALAMLGEIVASQTGAARKHDVDILRALGYDNGEGEITPFARVFPVGAHVGAERTQFGDGTPASVYRGLGRGLSALALSGSAMQHFVEWDLTNALGDQGSMEFLGWGNGQWDNIPWGSFGYASLSMGRDRYAEYSAQRLARSSADRLLHGHRQPGNPASDEEQVNATLDNQWANICANLGLPTSPQMGVGQWLAGTVLPHDAVSQHAQAIVNATLRPRIDQQPGVNGPQWAGALQRVLAEQRAQIEQAAADTAYGIGFAWTHAFGRALEGTTTHALATLGLPYATGLVKRAARDVSDRILPEAQQLSSSVPPDVVDMSPEAKRTIASLKGALNNPAALTEQVLEGITANVIQQIYAALSHNVANACGAMVGELFDPLVAALDESQTVLREAAREARTNTGLADLRTDKYVAWPADSDERVADRFSEADNEVMLTRSSDFKQRYEIDLPSSVGDTGVGPAALNQALGRATNMAITGLWPVVTGTQPPGVAHPVIERKNEWVSRAFPRNPETGETLIATPSAFDVHTRPAELLERTRGFVARPGESFDRYCSLSLRDFVTGRAGGVEQHVPESELTQRRRDVIRRFDEAVQLARPLSSVNEGALGAVHGVSEMVYRFKFSAVPFNGLTLGDEMAEELTRNPRIDHNSVNALTRALSDEGNVKRIDIFGTYPNYSPLVYEAVVEPAARQWLASSAIERQAFWKYRRTRPLAASLPMHENERRAMVAGWILGRAIGFIRVPEPPFTQPVQVWDRDAARWLSFPQPLLTPQTEFKAEYDWLPAIMESVLIAIAQSHQPPVMNSMLPYRAMRRIFDEGLNGMTAGLDQAHQSAAVNMADWLRTGDTRTGVASVLTGTGPEASIEERAEALRGYLNHWVGFTGQHFMKPGDGAEDGLPPAPGGGTFATVNQRRQASATPIFRDLAPDIYWVANRLLGLLDTAVAAAHRAPTAAGGPTVPAAEQETWTAPSFDGGTGGKFF